jgi:malonate transporter and related proteins
VSGAVLTNLFFSFNAVIPVFIIIGGGFFLKQKKILNDDFSIASNKLVFTIALPAMIFESVYQVNFKSLFDLNLIVFCVSGTLVQFALITAGAFGLLAARKSIGAFVQGGFRSNFVILGIPLIKNLSATLGADAVAKSSIIVSIIIPLYNVLAVIILTATALEKSSIWNKKLLFDIAKNPLILAVLLAIPFSVTGFRLPGFIEKTIAYMSAIAVPLALLDIGYNFKFKVFVGNLQLATASSVIKIIISPLVFTTAAYFLGFKGSSLGVIFILFASPTAVSSYIMAKNMNNDADLAANIVLLTTIGSLGTLFLGVFLLKSLGML